MSRIPTSRTTNTGRRKTEAAVPQRLAHIATIVILSIALGILIVTVAAIVNAVAAPPAHGVEVRQLADQVDVGDTSQCFITQSPNGIILFGWNDNTSEAECRDALLAYLGARCNKGFRGGISRDKGER